MSGLLLGMVRSVCTCWFHSICCCYYYYYYYVHPSVSIYIHCCKSKEMSMCTTFKHMKWRYNSIHSQPLPRFIMFRAVHPDCYNKLKLCHTQAYLARGATAHSNFVLIYGQRSELFRSPIFQLLQNYRVVQINQINNNPIFKLLLSEVTDILNLSTKVN
jgi:hypothetical protein